MPKPEGELIIRGQFRDRLSIACPWVVQTLRTFSGHSINLVRETTINDEARGISYRSQSFEQYSPDQARELAHALLKAADHSEGKEPK